MMELCLALAGPKSRASREITFGPVKSWMYSLRFSRRCATKEIRDGPYRPSGYPLFCSIGRPVGDNIAHAER